MCAISAIKYSPMLVEYAEVFSGAGAGTGMGGVALEADLTGRGGVEGLGFPACPNSLFMNELNDRASLCTGLR